MYVYVPTSNIRMTGVVMMALLQGESEGKQMHLYMSTTYVM